MVLSWRISNTLDADFCPSRQIALQSPAGQRCEALNEAIYRFGPPDIMNSDQGSQFTSFAWTDRLRRSYLHAWETGSEARAGVRNWMEFYNNRRPHKAPGGRPPAVVYSLQIEATQPDQPEQIRA